MAILLFRQNQKQHRWAKAAFSCALATFLVLLLSSAFYAESVRLGSVFTHAIQSVEQETVADLSSVLDGGDVWKRQDPPPLTWDVAVAKGRVLACLMENDETGAGAYLNTLKPGMQLSSTFTSYADLATWGWTTNSGYTEPGYEESIDNAITSLGIDLANNVPVRFDQNQMVTVGGVLYYVSLLARAV